MKGEEKKEKKKRGECDSWVPPNEDFDVTPFFVPTFLGIS